MSLYHKMYSAANFWEFLVEQMRAWKAKGGEITYGLFSGPVPWKHNNFFLKKNIKNQ